jgi:hypothetical protein
VLIRPSFEREGFWCVACPCGFEQAEDDYRAAYETADRHSSAHDGEGSPFGPRAPGGEVALSPDTGADVLHTTHELMLDFYSYCGRWQQNYPPAGDRTDDPEAWLNFLNQQQKLSHQREAAVLAYRRAYRATGIANLLRRRTEDPDWRSRLYAIATEVIASDEENWENDLVLTGDGLTLEMVIDLAEGTLDRLPEPIRQRITGEYHLGPDIDVRKVHGHDRFTGRLWEKPPRE